MYSTGRELLAAEARDRAIDQGRLIRGLIGGAVQSQRGRCRLPSRRRLALVARLLPDQLEPAHGMGLQRVLSPLLLDTLLDGPGETLGPVTLRTCTYK